MRRKTLAIAVMLMAFQLICFNNLVCFAKEAQASHKEDKKICRVCGMYIERFKHTAVYVDFKDGASQAYCGVSCAIRSINEKGGFKAVESAQVTGWISQEPVEMKEAVYVIGSKLIPDMLPNIIAFESKEKAEEFIKVKGGKIESLDSLFVSTSYRGLTMPFRIPSAAVPSQGVFNTGTGFSMKRMDHLMNGSRDITDTEGLLVRPMVPDTMTTYMDTTTIGYGITDDIFSAVNIPYVWKKMKSTMRNGSSAYLSTKGLGDVSLVNRWRFWHDLYFDKHLGLLGAVSFPTGNYRVALRDKAMMQIGTEAFAFTPGLLYSQHVGEFWFHVAGTYKFNLENSDDYKFGDNINAGFAIHWLPNTSDLLGFEFDLDKCLSNRYKDVEVAHTGRMSLNGNFVYQRKILLCWGGNLNLNLLFGFPFYESVNGVQGGEAYHASAGLQWQRKF